MKTKKIKNVNINLSLSKDTPAETLTQLYNVLNNLNAPQEQQKRDYELYLSYEDIEKLHDLNEELFKQVLNSQNLTPKQIEKECEILSQKYDFEVKELCKLREAEYWQRQAAIEAKNEHQIPWRRGWWWRLFFRPTTNRMQDIIEERAALDAAEYFDKEEKELEARAEKFYSDQEQSSDAPTAPAAVGDVQSDAEQQQPVVDVAEPPEPPARKPRKTT